MYNELNHDTHPGGDQGLDFDDFGANSSGIIMGTTGKFNVLVSADKASLQSRCGHPSNHNRRLAK